MEVTEMTMDMDMAKQTAAFENHMKNWVLA